MKLFFLISALLGAGALTAHAQTITVMAEQLAELKLFEKTATVGYELMTTGLDSIGQINDKEYQLHADYFRSLDAVKPVLDNDPLLVALRGFQSALIQQLQMRIDYWHNQKNVRQ